MRPFLTFTLLVLVLTGLLSAPAAAQQHFYQWRHVDQGELSLWQDGRQIGNLDLATGLYYPRLGVGQWGRPCTPPIAPPPGAIRMPTGVQLHKLPEGNHVYRNGKEIGKDAALKLLGVRPSIEGPDDRKIPDDRSKVRVTIIGTPEACAGPLAVAQKYPEFVSVAYRPEAWMIQRQGFAVTANPTISIQEPPGADGCGKEVRRLEGYQGDAAFETVLQEVAGRKIAPAPHYDPSKSDGWLARLKPFVPKLSGGVPWIPLAVIAVLVAVAIWRRRPKV